MYAIRLLLDQGIAADAAALFCALGYASHHVFEFGVQRAEAQEIPAKAAAEGFVILILDANFHTLVAVRILKVPAVIRLRKEGCRAEQVVVIVRQVLTDFQPQFTRGCLISVNGLKATMRLLPIGE